jgi:hypothetical protein
MDNQSAYLDSKRARVGALLIVLIVFGLLIGGIQIREEYASLRAKNDALKEELRESKENNASTSPLVAEPETDAPRRSLIGPPAVGAPIQIASKDSFLQEARQRAQADPEGAMRWLQEQSSGSERLRGMLEVVAIWAAEDSESALLWLESNAQGLARLETLNSGVELWAEKDPDAAAAWIDGMANDGSKITAAKSLASTWVKRSPSEASQWVTGLPSGVIRTEAARALANTWVEDDPEAASIWALGEAEFHGNSDLLIETIQTFTRQSPAEAETFLRQMTEAYDEPAVLTGHVSARAEADPASAAAWFDQLSLDDPLYSPEFANPILYAWTETDSVAASAWLSQQPAGPERDAAISGFAESIQRFEPSAAATWANTISDPDQRVQELEKSVRTWATQNADHALEWVHSSGLPPALHQDLVSIIENAR